MSDLPGKPLKSEQTIVSFFDNQFQKPVEFASNDFDASVGFFVKRGFERIAAQTISQVLLQQAKKEKIKIFTILDTLKVLNKVQLNKIVITILNASRDRSSKLGYKTTGSVNTFESRSIIT